MARFAAAVTVALLILAGVAPAASQDGGVHPGAETNPAAVKNLKLSPEQKQTIYTSISNQKQKETAPPTFRAAIGVVVPSSIELQPLPKTIVELIPDLRDFEYAMVANQVLLVDPKNKQVIEIIN